jgi:uncharacterized protein YfdQ (DUF2303 family)
MDRSAIEALQQSGTGLAPRIYPAGDGVEPIALLPQGGGGFRIESLEKYRTSLDRVRQSVCVLTAESFVAYWTRFAKDDSVIFADEPSGRYVAIIDYHTRNGDPRFCQHGVVYQTQPSLEWETWIGCNGKSMPQADFARFVEDNYIDVVEPAHADMIAVATNLNAKKSVEFASSTSLQTGEVQFLYQEKISGTADKRQGSIKIPEKFVVEIPVLLGDIRVRIEARFRYRIEEGKLRMWYDLHRPEHHKVAAIRRATEQIRKGLPDAPFYLGSAR